MREMQAHIASVLGLHRTNSRVSLNSTFSFSGSINTKKAYKKFCKGLYHIGVTAEPISQIEGPIHNIFKSQDIATSSQIDDVSIEDQIDITTPENQIASFTSEYQIPGITIGDGN